MRPCSKSLRVVVLCATSPARLHGVLLNVKDIPAQAHVGLELDDLGRFFPVQNIL